MSLVSSVLDRVIFYGLLATIVLTAIPYGTVQPWWIALFECIVFALGALALIDLFVTKSALPEGTRLAVPLLALCLFILFQALPIFQASTNALSNVRRAVSADPFSSLQLAVKLFAFIVAGVLILRYAASEKRLRLLVYVVIGVGVASALFGVLRHGMQTGTAWILPFPDESRGFAQFVNRNHFAFLIEMALGLTLGMLVGEARNYLRVAVFLAIAVFLWVVLIFANSRGGIFASVSQFLFLVLLLDPFRRLTGERDGTGRKRVQTVTVGLLAQAVLIVVLGGVLLAGVSWVGGERVASNIELASTAYDQPGLVPRENTHRKQIWSSTWNMFKQNPIAGRGFGGYWIGITKYHDASGQFTPQEAHNDYLELLASGGLIGTALVVWFVVRLIKQARQNLRAGDRSLRPAVIGALVGIFGVMIHSFVDFGLHITANALVFTALTAIIGLRPKSATTQSAHLINA